MALRIRENGNIVCAALHKEEDGDTYIPDKISEILTGCTGEDPILITDPEPIHSTHGRWWWNKNQGIKMREKLISIIAENLDIHIDNINNDSSFRYDLGADSLDMIELSMVFEEHFDCVLDYCDFAQFETVKNVLDYINLHKLG